jgi:P-type Cu+ transporter
MAREKKDVLDRIDPVCGMTVNSDQAEKAHYQGETFYFCSKDCKDKFQAQPADYAESVIPK